jgi:hypothetical protein
MANILASQSAEMRAKGLTVSCHHWEAVSPSPQATIARTKATSTMAAIATMVRLPIRFMRPAPSKSPSLLER